MHSYLRRRTSSAKPVIANNPALGSGTAVAVDKVPMP